MDKVGDSLPDIILESSGPDASPHPLNNVDPRSIDLPGPNWNHFKPTETSLVIVEMTAMPGSPSLRPRKHVHVNLVNGMCTSYVLDRKISEVPALTTNDVERCVEELDMMHICVGGPSAADHPPMIRSNAHVDCIGKWRHNGCKIIAPRAGMPCNCCDTLDYELSRVTRRQKNVKSIDIATVGKIFDLGNLSHRRQSQIIALLKSRQNWLRKKQEAEKEMKFIDEIISEMPTGSEKIRGDEDDEDDEDDDDDDDDD